MNLFSSSLHTTIRSFRSANCVLENIDVVFDRRVAWESFGMLLDNLFFIVWS
ncbi:hypothetical protein Plhal703r1_c38g0135761 [Plasmopara halstedii]